MCWILIKIYFLQVPGKEIVHDNIPPFQNLSRISPIDEIWKLAWVSRFAPLQNFTRNMFLLPV